MSATAIRRFIVTTVYYLWLFEVMIFGNCQSTRKRLGLATLISWTQLEFDYPSEAARQQEINSGNFNPRAALPIDVDVFYNYTYSKTIFVTIPRSRVGIPATLGTVTNRFRQGNPIIAPYPSWSWHTNLRNCSVNRILSVYRVQIDKCGNMWVLDTGRIGNSMVCQPQILVFDLYANSLVHRYEIPKNQVEPRSILVTPVVDIRDTKCIDAMVYIADCQAFSIIVHDPGKRTSWRITDKTFYPYPSFGTFRIQGESFDLMDGILGMALEPLAKGKDRILYYHALASATENWVYTSQIRNQERFANSSSAPQIFNVYRKQRPSQSAGMAIDSRGIAYFGLMETSINCWNTRQEYGPENIGTIERNPFLLQFASGVKIVKAPNGQEELWIVTNRLQKVLNNTLSQSETNFRILRGNTANLIRNTRCDLPNYTPVWEQKIKPFSSNWQHV